MKYFFLCISFVIVQLSFSQNDAVLDVGQNLIYENKLDAAITYYEKHLAETNNEEQKAYFLLGLAEIYKLKLKHDIANNYYVQAFNAIKSSNNINLEFLYHVKMVEFYRKRVLFKEAVEHLNKASLIINDHQIKDANLAEFYGRKQLYLRSIFLSQILHFFMQKKHYSYLKKLTIKMVFFILHLKSQEYMKKIRIIKKL